MIKHDDMPSIHSCYRLSAENERLQKKIKQIKKKNIMLELSLKELKEKENYQNLLKSCATSKDVGVQTEIHKPIGFTTRKKTEEDASKSASTQVMSMYKNLITEQQRQLKSEIKQTQQISALKIKVQTLEDRIHELKIQNEHLQNDLHEEKHSAPPTVEEFRKIKRERNKLHHQNKKLLKELKGIDTFFEEVDDVKFGLEQSTKLNRRYDQCLRHMCKKFGVPYTKPGLT